MKRIQVAAVLLACMMVLASCGFLGKSGEVIRYDIASGTENLDPQFADDDTSRMIISNIYEGLFRQEPTGEVVPCVASGYTVSQDKLVYTITLREDARWYNGELVTAHDFAFGLSRLFGPEAFSPFAGDLSSIKNAKEILAGRMGKEALGVRALDSSTLEITLDRPDNLLELLCASYAMPCNQDFFESTQARYGMSSKTVLVNGPFYVSIWNNKRVISLRPNKQYVSPDPVLCAGVDLYIPASMQQEASDDKESYDPVDRFFAGTTDAVRIDYSKVEQAQEMGAGTSSFEDTVWVLVLNQRLDYFQNENMRKALAYSINRELLENEFLGANLRVTSTLVPPAVGAGEQSYREYAGEASPIGYDPGLAGSYYTAALSELDISALPIKEILIADSDNQTLLTGYVQQGFGKHLHFATGLVTLPKEALMQRVLAGDFEAAIVPLSAAYSSPDAIFAYYKSSGAQNVAGYEDTSFDALLADAFMLDRSSRNEVYRQAEQKLLSEAVAIPLYFETSYYATQKNVSGLEFSPFLTGVYFKYAERK